MIKKDEQGKVVEYEDESVDLNPRKKTVQPDGNQDTKGKIVFVSEAEIDAAYALELANVRAELETSLVEKMKPLLDKVSTITNRWDGIRGSARAKRDLAIKEAHAELEKKIVEVKKICDDRIAAAREGFHNEINPVNQEAADLKSDLKKRFDEGVESCQRRRNERQVVLMEAKRLEAETAKKLEAETAKKPEDETSKKLEAETSKKLEDETSKKLEDETSKKLEAGAK